MNLLKNWFKSAGEKRQEQLSAYLDGQLSARERQQFEEQVAGDDALRADLEQQRLIKSQLSQLPRRRAPRNFMLDPARYGRPAPQPSAWLYPTMRAATAFAAIFFILAVVFELVSVATLDLRSDQVAFESAPAMAPATVEDQLRAGAEVEPERLGVMEMAEEEAELAAMAEAGDLPEPVATAAAVQALEAEAYPAPAAPPPGMPLAYPQPMATLAIEIQPPALATPPAAGDTVTIPEASAKDEAEPASLLTVDEPALLFSTWRVVQAALGTAVLLLALATFWLRRRLL